MRLFEEEAFVPLLLAAQKYCEFVPVEGSRARHEAFHELRDIVKAIRARQDDEFCDWIGYGDLAHLFDQPETDEDVARKLAWIEKNLKNNQHGSEGSTDEQSQEST
jgi:hypothetical protein